LVKKKSRIVRIDDEFFELAKEIEESNGIAFTDATRIIARQFRRKKREGWSIV
jgi:antitoxin component of RelBE/YafQ-DinJ toxin-antitoxin module